MEHAWDVHEYVWNVLGICMEYVWTMHGLCMEYAWNAGAKKRERGRPPKGFFYKWLPEPPSGLTRASRICGLGLPDISRNSTPGPQGGTSAEILGDISARLM